MNMSNQDEVAREPFEHSEPAVISELIPDCPEVADVLAAVSATNPTEEYQTRDSSDLEQNLAKREGDEDDDENLADADDVSFARAFGIEEDWTVLAAPVGR